MKEIFKDIKGYEGLYEISNYGNVRSLYNYRGGHNILKPKEKKNGYYQIGLRKYNKRKWYSIHRLVAEAFIPNPNKLLQINHINENKKDNRVENLEWCNQLYNNTYGTRINRLKDKLNQKIYQYDLNLNLIKEWNSSKEASEELNIPRGNISMCLNAKYKQTHNFIFKREVIK